jgi:type II secretory pathway pseudopilin PulG
MRRREESRVESGMRMCHTTASHRRVRQAGFSYIEVLVSILLIVLALIPAIESLSTGVRAAGIHQSMAEADLHMVSKLEETLARSFAALDAEALAVGDPALPTSFSDAPGAAHRRLVYLARYDGDDADDDGKRFTGGDAGLLWVKVELENTGRALETRTAN